jgi:diadenosine tetraphosphate (Ap4A) HIT family hydrolase
MTSGANTAASSGGPAATASGSPRMPPSPEGGGTPCGWSLDPQLDRDTSRIGDLALSRLLVSNDANYPWLLLVPRRPGANEIIDLDSADQHQLAIEIAAVSEGLKAVTACDKLNVAAIGNLVPQLHVHIVARRRDDPAWPKPVWGAVPAREWEPAARELLVTALRDRLGIA